MSTWSSSETRVATSRGRAPWLPGIAVALIAIVAMCGALGGPFIYDDIALIEGNSYVHGIEHWRRWFSGRFVDTNMEPSLAAQARAFFRPLVIASYALDWQWTGGAPWGFHLTNLVIHGVNSLLLLLLLRGWGVREWAAVVAAVVFAVHPVQTETVAWISGRTDGLCLLGLLVATLGVRRVVTAGGENLRWMIGVAACLGGLLLAFGSKEAAVVFPVFFGVEVWARQGSPLEGRALRRLTVQTAPFLVVALAYVVVHRVWFDSGSTVATPPAVLRVPFVLEAIGRYTALVLLPTDLSMGRGSLHYENGAITPVWSYVTLGALALVAIAWIAITRRRKAPAVSLGLLAAVALLTPVSSIVWLGYEVLVSPRFLYIPMVGLAAALAAALSAWGPLSGGAGGDAAMSDDAWRGRAIGWACALGATVLFALSFLRSLDFSSEEAFWQRELENNPQSLAAQRHFVGRELRERRPRAGVALAQHFFSTSPFPEPMKAPLVLEALAGLAMLIPDASPSLLGLQQFVREVADGKGGRFVLPEHELSLSIPAGSGLAKALGGEARRLDMLLAELAARVGDEGEARQRVERALAGCGDCWTHLMRAARVLAQCGDIDRARELALRVTRLTADEASRKLLDDIAFAKHVLELSRATASPALTSQYYAIVGALGRAYRAATPAFEQPPDDPEALLGLAALAIRAGDVAQARRLLATRFPPERVDAEIEEVMLTVPWRDQARPAGEWTPEVLALASAAE